MAVDICRAAALAVLGASGKVSFKLYETFDAVRAQHDDVAFLTRQNIAEQQLAGEVQPGKVVFIDALALMVAEASPIHRLAELSGRSVCLMIGSDAQMALDDAASRLGLHFARLAFEEDVEMLDAYNAQRCQAAVGESTRLAQMRGTPGVNHLASRLLPRPLALIPVMATTPIVDPHWSALVYWVIDAWVTGAAVDVPGLRPGWQDDVHAALGSYEAVLRRHLADRLGLAPGPNARWPDGVPVAP